ncbi:hypothetical protein SCHPADRAFT_754325 [Schizopora paradoxa]|uniref:Uncharacterized protein n=1 Tax=Schizopora paradoxa TaxID=27342 RepID=A0A0H2QYL6_9AGAM|nr:hypothetical protein SCHPADRAFT_754325 [Schizopora paradoxa]
MQSYLSCRANPFYDFVDTASHLTDCDLPLCASRYCVGIWYRTSILYFLLARRDLVHIHLVVSIAGLLLASASPVKVSYTPFLKFMIRVMNLIFRFFGLTAHLSSFPRYFDNL